MAENTQATFEEVLSIEASLGKFQASLDAITAAYKSWMDGLGSISSEVLGVGAISQIQSAIKDLTDTLSVYNQEALDSAQHVEAAVIEVLQNIDERDEEFAQKERERAKATAEAKIAANASVAAARKELDPKDLGSGGVDKKSQEILTEQEGVINKTQSERVTLLEKQEALARQIQIEQEGIENSSEVERLAILEKQVAAARTISIEQEGVENSAEAERLAILEKQVIAARTIAIEQEGVENSAERERLAILEKQVAVAREIQIEQQGITDAFAVKQEAAISKQQTAAADGLESFVGMAKQMVVMYALWTAIQAVIETISSTIKAPFEALSSGVKYLDEVSAAADRLTGTLAANVKFSEDLGTNFTIASEVAKDMVRDLQLIAANTGISYENLQKAATGLITAGAAYHLQNVREIDTLAQMLVIGNAQVKGAENFRGVLSDIPKFLDGTLQKGSALLEVLRLTPIEAKKLVDATSETKDLLQQLEPAFAPYLSAAQQATLHHQNIVNALDLQLKRLEAIAATPAYETLTKILKEILDWVGQNEIKLNAWAKVAGEIVELFLKLAGALTGIDKSNVVDVIGSGIAVWAVGVAFMVEQMVDAVVLLKDIARVVAASASGPLAAAAAASQLKSNWDDASESVKKYEKILTDVKSAILAPTGGRDTNGLDIPIGGKNPPVRTDQVAGKADIKGSYDRDIEAIKELYGAQVEAVKEGVAKLELSKRDAARDIELIDNAEIVALKARGAAYHQALSDFYDVEIGTGKKTGADKSNALEEDTARQQKLIAGVQATTNAARKAGEAEATSVAKIESTSRLTILKEEATSELQIEKDLLAAGYETRLENQAAVEALEKRAFDLEKANLVQLASSQAAGSTQRAETESKIAELSQKRLNTLQKESLTDSVLREQQAQSQREFSIALEQSSEQAVLLEDQIAETLTGSKKYYLDIFDIRDKDIAQMISEKTIELELAQSRNAGADAVRKLTLEMSALNNERLKNVQGRVAAINASGAPQGIKDIETLGAVQSARDALQRQGPADLSDASVDAFHKQLDSLNEILAKASPSFDNTLHSLEQKFLHFDISAALEALKDGVDRPSTALEEFAVGLEAVSQLLSSLSAVVSSVENAAKKGGLAGGLGAGLSAAGGIVGAINPIAGAITEALGGVLQFFGSLFTKTAAQVAQDINKTITKINDAYTNGQQTLSATISALEAQRNAAISELSGKKGGQDELDKLLPQLDQQIEQLAIQQKQTISNFEQQLDGLRTQSSVLQGIQQQWTQIVDSVQKYLSAGGDAVLATQYLSYELQQMQKDAQAQLDSANQTAIQDAISLNGLLQQRVDLENQFARQQFDSVNSDSIEKRQAGAISRAADLAQQQQQYQEQLDALNYQITTATQKVTLESTVFSIATDINDLHRQDDNLTLKALDDQISKYNDLKSLVNSIYQNAGGAFTSNNPLLTGTPSVTVNILGDINGVTPLNATTLGTQIGQGVSVSLQQAVIDGLRNGLNP